MNYKQYIATFNRRLASVYRRTLSFVYARQYRGMYKRLNLSRHSYDQQLTAWKDKWCQLGAANPIYFKLFCEYIGPDVNIVPEDISHNVIEPLLNPPAMRDFFQDKNMFDKLVPEGIFPKTLLRRINGFFYDAHYRKVACDTTEDILAFLEGYDKVIAKVTVDSSSGIGVRMLFHSGTKWYDKDISTEVSISELNQLLGDNYIIQECLNQADFMSQFCKSSVNTIRLFVYKSVKTDEPHALAAVMRIGKEGTYKDNAHLGGAVVGIGENGVINNFITDQYGNKFSIHNNIDFSKHHFVLPSWEGIKRFGEDIVRQIPYHRCFNLDIMIDNRGEPRLIEINLRSMGIWLYQFNTGSCYGEYTDEVIEYCKENLKELKNEYLLL